MSHMNVKVSHYHEKGFSLIELMIVVAIIAVLSGIALPAYQEQVRESRRTDAKAGLANFASALERYYAINQTFAGVDGTANLAGNNVIALNSLFPTELPTHSPDKFYDVRLDFTERSYTVRAAPKNQMVGDGVFELVNTGEQRWVQTDGSIWAWDGTP